MKRRQLLVGGAAASLPIMSGCTSLDQKESQILNRNNLTLSNGEMQLKLNPKLGGSISTLKWKDHQILRPTPESNMKITDTANFPLVPIVNRIPEGKFTFEGTEVDLDGNFMGLPDFIHGFGWRETWRVERATKTKALLSYLYSNGKWPWAFKATQVFELSSNALRLTLSVQNLSSQNMPADLGFHPYFPTTPATRLFAEYDGHWINNEFGHAVRRVEGSYRQDFTKGEGLFDPVMTDQTHYGWDGIARLKEAGRPTIRIKADSKVRNLHIFFPPNGDFVAVEPTLGRGNPFGVLPIEYKVLAPQERLSIWMEIEVEERDV